LRPTRFPMVRRSAINGHGQSAGDARNSSQIMGIVRPPQPEVGPAPPARDSDCPIRPSVPSSTACRRPRGHGHDCRRTTRARCH
jgi:hypothetical protein